MINPDAAGIDIGSKIKLLNLTNGVNITITITIRDLTNCIVHVV